MKRIPFLYQGVSLLIFIPLVLYFWTGKEWTILLLYPVMAGGTFVLAWSVRHGYRFLSYYEMKERFAVGLFYFGLWIATLFAVGPLVDLGFGWAILALVLIDIVLAFYARPFPWQWKRGQTDNQPRP